MDHAALKSNFAVLVPDFPSASYLTNITSWFNSAQRKVSEKLLVTAKSTTPSIAGSSSYDMPDDYIEIKRQGVAYDGIELTPATLTILAEEYPEGWANLALGTPEFYMIDGGAITLIPTPNVDDIDISLEYWGYANDLVSDTDVPFTTGDETNGFTVNNRLRGLDDLLLEYAIGMAKFSLGFYSTTQNALSNFYTLLDSRATALNKKPDLEYTQKRHDPYVLRNKQSRLNGI
jgi:hypothetical protein